MAIKECAYRNCTNRILPNTSTSKYFMFDFPINEKLRNEWVTIGKVADYDPKKVYFMCSHHFDKKYISIINNYVSLVENAIPNGGTSSVIEMDGGKKKFNVKDDAGEKNEKSFEETGKNKEVGLLKSNKPKNHKSLAYDKHFELELVTKATLDGDNEGQQIFNISGISLGTDSLDVKPNEFIKIFMFKGKEFVEMKKSYYLQEKAKLMEELEYYKTFVSKIKNQYADFKSNLP